MIKINLIRDVTEIGKNKFGGSSLGAGIDAGAILGSRESAIKISTFFLPMIGLMLYEQYNLSHREDERAQLETKVQQIRQNVEKLKPEIEEVRRFGEENTRLTKQIEAIRKLSRERLQNVKTLSAIQSIIPQKAWLKSLKIEGSKVSMTGMATEDTVVGEFMQGLDQSIFFTNVNLISSEDFRTPDGTVFKSFSVDCQTENM